MDEISASNFGMDLMSIFEDDDNALQTFQSANGDQIVCLQTFGDCNVGFVCKIFVQLMTAVFDVYQ